MTSDSLFTPHNTEQSQHLSSTLSKLAEMTMPITYNNNDPLGYGNVIFHHIPNAMAPSFQAFLIVYCICAGIIGLELITNLDYDWALARRSGWASWSKCPNRIAYFVSRYLSFVFLIMVIVYSVTPGLNCHIYAKGSNVMWFLPISCVDFIFMQRTIALYSWNRFICCLLYPLYILNVLLAASAVLWFGRGYRIPGSDFCAYFTDSGTQPHATLFIVYCVVLNCLDTLILALTCHRLIEGGLTSVPRSIRHRFLRLFTSNNTTVTAYYEAGALPRQDSISSLLVRQGLHYYAILELARLAYMIVYYGFATETATYQLICTAILATLSPLLANRLFRQTSEFVQGRTMIRSDQGNSTGKVMSQPIVSPDFLPQPTSYGYKGRQRRGRGQDDDETHDRPAAAASIILQPRRQIYTNGLRIIVNERLSSFVDDYEDQDVVATLPRLHRRDSRYSDPPLTSKTLTDQRPFVDTLPIEGSPSNPEMQFEIQSKQ